MDEQNNSNEVYVPRPRWQVWVARAALAVVIVGVVCYYWSIAHPV